MKTKIAFALLFMTLLTKINAQDYYWSNNRKIPIVRDNSAMLMRVPENSLASCGQSKEEKLISDYVQTFGDSKIDANFKMKNLEELNDITAKDSLEISKIH